MKAIKVQIYPNKSQKEMISRTMGCCRFIYNWALERRIASYQSAKQSIGKWTLIKEITSLKAQSKTEWLKEVPSQSLQCAVADLDSAFSHFFRKNNKFPRFKSKRNQKQSYRVPQGFEVNRETHYLKLPKLGWIRFIDEFKIPESVHFKFITVSVRNEKYFASLTYDDGIETPDKVPIEPDNAIGIDLGVAVLATLSDETKIENPKHLKKHEEALKEEQRRLEVKEEGTQAYRKQKRRLGKAHKKVADTRRDFLHKLTTSLVENQDWTTFCVEDLAVKEMQQKASHILARFIGDAGWRMFRQMMEYKCDDRGKNLIVIGRFDASSKTCTCGLVNRALTLSDRSWVCPSCGENHDRDILAANNIKRFGLRKAGQSLLAS